VASHFGCCRRSAAKLDRLVEKDLEFRARWKGNSAHGASAAAACARAADVAIDGATRDVEADRRRHDVCRSFLRNVAECGALLVVGRRRLGSMRESEGAILALPLGIHARLAAVCEDDRPEVDGYPPGAGARGADETGAAKSAGLSVDLRDDRRAVATELERAREHRWNRSASSSDLLVRSGVGR